MSQFQNQVALVTGGGTGVGRSTVLKLASEGASVVVNYSRSEDDAMKTASEASEHGVRCVAMQADVSDESQVANMFQKIEAEFGRLDILVNNAATTEMIAYTDLDELSSEIWDRVLGVNVKGAFFCCRSATPLMKQSGRLGSSTDAGQIVNVSSIAGVTGLGSSIAYAASKGALINMTRAFAVSQAPSIRVNAVAPGVIETRWIEGWEKYTDPHKQSTPLQRHSTPDDIAIAIYSLLINPMVTGQTLVVDGGRTIGAS